MKFPSQILFNFLFISGSKQSRGIYVDNSENDRKALEWFLSCGQEMHRRKFREAQLTICDAYIAIAHFRCKILKKAYELFMRNLDYKKQHLPEPVLYEFIQAGLETMTALDKTDERIIFQRLQLQMSKMDTEQFVTDYLKLFAMDYKNKCYGEVEESPLFQEVMEAIKKFHSKPHPDIKHNAMYIDFANELIKLEPFSPVIPKLFGYFKLDLSSLFLALDPCTFSSLFKFAHVKMVYFFKTGQYEDCIENSAQALLYYENFSQHDGNEDFCPGEWCPKLYEGDAHLKLGRVKEAQAAYESAIEKCNEAHGSALEFCNLNCRVANLNFQLGIYTKASLFHDMTQKIIRTEPEVIPKLEFDPWVKEAQCLRKDGKIAAAEEKVKQSLKSSPEFIDFFSAVLVHSQSIKSEDAFFGAQNKLARIVEKKIHDYSDVVKLLEENREHFLLFPQDAEYWTRTVLSLSFGKLSPQCKGKVQSLHNSLKIASYFANRLEINYHF